MKSNYYCIILHYNYKIKALEIFDNIEKKCYVSDIRKDCIEDSYFIFYENEIIQYNYPYVKIDLNKKKFEKFKKLSFACDVYEKNLFSFCQKYKIEEYLL